MRIWDTLPFRVRYEEYQAIAAARPGAQLIVDTLWQEPIDARAMAKQLRENQSLTKPERRAALNLVLQRSAQLQQHVADLHARLVFTDDVVAALEADDLLSSTVRSRAVGIARRKGDQPLRLNRDSWNLVRPPGGTPQAYRLGLRGAEAAVALEPDNADFLDTLGIAQYLNDRYEDAYVTVIRSDEIRRQNGRKSVPRNLAVLSMALFKLGRIEQARAAFQRLENVMSDTEEDWRFNETTSALFKECKQLLESSNEQSEHPGSKRVED